ncbi:MAG TPA: hypothetical protein VFS17_06580 [Methylophilaceae bacterium]|nr:hypothetical protein [Methylophilaceae bacterium]
MNLQVISGKDKKMKNLRKTHPMVLVAAVALTMFSLLGSAAITGLLPNISEKQGSPAKEENSGIVTEQASEAHPAASGTATRPETDKSPKACLNCGTVVAILALEGEISSASGNKAVRLAPAYQVKVRMHNGSYQTLTQHSRPTYLIGDVIRLERRQATV